MAMGNPRDLWPIIQVCLPKLEISARGGRKTMLLVYAWNEFGQGGIMAPCSGEKDMRLEAAREVFGE